MVCGEQVEVAMRNTAPYADQFYPISLFRNAPVNRQYCNLYRSTTKGAMVDGSSDFYVHGPSTP